MRFFVLGLAAVVFIAMDAPAYAQRRSIAQAPDNLQDLFRFLYQCATVPAGTEGSELTLRFSLTQYGALRGKPMITYSKLVGSPVDQRVFVSAALGALEKCTPVPLTERFGKVISQRVLVMMFPRPRQQGV